MKPIYYMVSDKNCPGTTICIFGNSHEIYLSPPPIFLHDPSDAHRIAIGREDINGFTVYACFSLTGHKVVAAYSGQPDKEILPVPETPEN